MGSVPPLTPEAKTGYPTSCQASPRSQQLLVPFLRLLLGGLYRNKLLLKSLRPRPGVGSDIIIRQWFSDLSRHQHHLENLLSLMEPIPRVSGKIGLGRSPELAFL